MKNEKVTEYLENVKSRKQELLILRDILLGTGMEEEWKWTKPCYTFQGNNIAMIQDFKSYLAVLFFKGCLLQDPENKLVKPGENSNVARQLRFENVEDVLEKKSLLLDYLTQAMVAEEEGKIVESKTKHVEMPEELETALEKDPSFQRAFEQLTPGRRRAYILFISSAKQSQTRISRVESNRNRILAGKGLNDPF